MVQYDKKNIDLVAFCRISAHLAVIYRKYDESKSFFSGTGLKCKIFKKKQEKADSNHYCIDIIQFA